MLELEVLVGELLAVDGLATRALLRTCQLLPRLAPHGEGAVKLTLPRVKSPP